LGRAHTCEPDPIRPVQQARRRPIWGRPPRPHARPARAAGLPLSVRAPHARRAALRPIKAEASSLARALAAAPTCLPSSALPRRAASSRAPPVWRQAPTRRLRCLPAEADPATSSVAPRRSRRASFPHRRTSGTPPPMLARAGRHDLPPPAGFRSLPYGSSAGEPLHSTALTSSSFSVTHPSL
jgi:hypothetical protein